MSTNSPSRKVAKWPNGFRLKRTFKSHAGWIGRIAWSPDGRLIASGSDDRTIALCNPADGNVVRKLEGHSDTVFSVAWSRDGKLLASSSDDETIRLWNPDDGTSIRTLSGHTSGVVNVTWLPDNQSLASGGGDKGIRVWNTENGELLYSLEGHTAWIRQLRVSPNGKTLASASYDSTVRLWELDSRKCVAVLEGHTDRVHSAVWSPDGQLLASASADSTIRIWDAKGTHLRTLEDHGGAVYDLSFSNDGTCLASKSLDNSVRIWRCDTWTRVAVLPEESVATDFGGLAFHPKRSMLATLGDYDTVVRVWEIDSVTLLTGSPQRTSFYTSAKIVLVGESNVGKSCLALRLAEDRYETQATTHGMRFWVVSPEQLSSTATTPRGVYRDIVLWDMGGQDEYRLIHQMFLHDTTVALLLFDPTRGRTAFEEVEGWNRRLEKQLHGRRAIKLLVGTKMDDPLATVEQTLIDRLVADCGFAGYYPVSSQFGTGVPEFRDALYRAIDWELLTKTSGPEAFHQIYDEVEKARNSGEAVLPISELSQRLGRQGAIAQDAIDAAVDQLALQGVIASTTLASGDRALVLRIDEVERYAGSLILVARANPRGIPAIEERSISSRRMVFPRINEDDRLPWLQERAVLECVIQLLIEHDICLRHEGLLVFPSLFLTETGEDPSAPKGVALHYDFTGAIDNIYASLVAKLSLSSQFGRYRLWENRAEWETADRGTCGIRKISYKSGLGHIDLYFADQVDSKRRELFTVFVEDHLRQHGVEITETIHMVCSCGYDFEDKAVRARLVARHLDIICSICEVRNRISEGALKIRSSDPSVEKSLIALKTVIDKRRRVQVEDALAKFRGGVLAGVAPVGPVRILHLSDLHMSADPDLDPETMFQQLLADLKVHKDLAIQSLNYLFVTGDLTTCASPEEFEKAYQFISRIIEAFQLDAARCVIVPGNHDIDWNETVYEWKSNRLVDFKALRDGTYVPQGQGVLIRNELLYPRRFKNFSDQFYMFLRQEEYPLAFEEQAIPFLFADSRIQLLALNSCWEIDEFFPTRSSIYPKALAKGLLAADEQLEQARKSRPLNDGSEVLRLAVWHHPVTGNEKISDAAFLERLRQAGFKLCLHGHVHELRTDLIGYTDPERQIYVAGAGSFGAPANQRPESVPRLYNLLEISPDRSEIKVHTRFLQNPSGAWDGWAMWDNGTRQGRQTYYSIRLVPKVNQVRVD